ncbi:MAG: cell wall hydrolase, partial [Alphaproteobacteria bacterium]|nr:cell wall hydrolase [Alphaproteobacteria bacterium]
MQLSLIKNPDETQVLAYNLARIVFAETKGISLKAVEAMASMIYNIHIKYEKSFEDIATDKNIFDALNEKSPQHKFLSVDANDKKFQMCLRIVKTMLHGNLSDSVFGATRFHHTDVLPQWAIARGYIFECEDILYYL